MLFTARTNNKNRSTEHNGYGTRSGSHVNCHLPASEAVLQGAVLPVVVEAANVHIAFDGPHVGHVVVVNVQVGRIVGTVAAVIICFSGHDVGVGIVRTRVVVVISSARTPSALPRLPRPATALPRKRARRINAYKARDVPENLEQY